MNFLVNCLVLEARCKNTCIQYSKLSNSVMLVCYCFGIRALHCSISWWFGGAQFKASRCQLSVEHDCVSWAKGLKAVHLTLTSLFVVSSSDFYEFSRMSLIWYFPMHLLHENRWNFYHECSILKTSLVTQTSSKIPEKRIGGAGYRSPYLSHAKRALYHLSYTPDIADQVMISTV